MATKGTSPGYSLLTLRKGLAVLELIAQSKGEESLTELSTRLGEPVSVVFRILKTLEDLGYVEQDVRTKRYGLGLKIWEIGERALARFNIVEIARPVLSRLTAETGDTSSLAVLRGDSFVYVATQEGCEPLRAYVEAGSRQPLVLPTASGRAILAFSSPEFVEEILEREVERRTPLTVVDKGAIREILREAYDSGVAIVHGENQEHLSAVAAPIFDADDACVAALAVSGITHRFEGTALRRLIVLVKAAAAEITQKLSGGLARRGSPNPFAASSTQGVSQET
jgi:IclR family acetate operon transcriptional repressor